MDEKRILSHMNKDHKLAIEDYLSVYGGIKVDSHLSNIRMTNIDLTSITITFNHTDLGDQDIVKPIQFDAPLTSLSESRFKLIEMAKYAAQKRNVSHFQIQDIVYPSSIPEFTLLSLFFLLIFSYFRKDLIYDSLFKNYLNIPPNIVLFLKNNVHYTIFITILGHLSEFYLILLPKLRFYRVPFDFKIEWFFFTFLEGYLAIRRFNKLVQKYSSH
ncbi:uncharacterized protein ASCRUDRAFT_75240 [Ascoidea rubescens DSM 1968]|uniref:DUF2470 domain-containing protein n=1 Tax=Ascoidea rubescens DSM 1968 TaxID=1344418 RepID=A0A1D2VK79_9ASCO|nr:hypothetical protein ASCRUDRAFT_75240 [Ascoidea rubescens DSM 1968]ODV62008.1 hypothetical protein ASCRUDRAFT_75240 [Ascoidea rubescens DSM 1968]